jgi:lipopolysaccharide export LptBFGC system permease protein LptF
MNSRSIGIAAGLALAGFSITGNLLRGDRHLVSTVPDVLTGAAMGLVLMLGVWRAVRQHPANARTAGQQATLAASSVFAACLAAFAFGYLPIHSLGLASLAGLIGFVLMYVGGGVVNRLAARLSV